MLRIEASNRVIFLGGGFVANSSRTLWDPTTARLLCPLGFCKQEYWSGLPFPSPGDLPHLGDQTWVSCIAGGFFINWAIREEIPLTVLGLDEVTQAKGEFSQRSNPLHYFPGELWVFFSRTAVLWRHLKTTEGRQRLSASLDALCLEWVPLPGNQKTLGSEMRRWCTSCDVPPSEPWSLTQVFRKEKEKKNQSASTPNNGVSLTVHIKGDEANSRRDHRQPSLRTRCEAAPLCSLVDTIREAIQSQLKIRLPHTKPPLFPLKFFVFFF